MYNAAVIEMERRALRLCILMGLVCVVVGCLQFSVSPATTSSLHWWEEDAGSLGPGGVTDGSGGFSILIPWMDPPVYVVGTLTDCSGLFLADTPISVALVPQESGATIASIEDIGGFTVSAAGYAVATITQFEISGQTLSPLGDISLIAVSAERNVATSPSVLDVPLCAVGASDSVDGTIGDDWLEGSRADIQIGEYPAVVHAQHDGETIYLAIELFDAGADLSCDDLTFCFVFDNGDGELLGAGDDQIRVPIAGGPLSDGIDYVGALDGDPVLDPQQDVVGCATRTVDGEDVRYAIEIARPIDSGDDASDVTLVPGTESVVALGFAGTWTPCDRQAEEYVTVALGIAAGEAPGLEGDTSMIPSSCGPYVGVTDASGGISILIPWMDPPAYVVGTLSDCTGLLLANPSISVTLVPKKSEGSISTAQDVGAVIVHSTGDGATGYGWEIVPEGGYEDVAGAGFAYTAPVDPSGSTTATLDLGDVCLEASPQVTLAGVTDANGQISVLIPWMEPLDTYIVGTLTDCSGSLLAGTPISLILEPKETGATISHVEDIDGVIVAAHGFLHGYSSDPVNDLSYTSSVDLSGNATATLRLGDFCVQDIVCSAYSQAMSEMSDIEARAVELHNRGRDASDAAASQLYQDALASQQLLLARIDDLATLVGEHVELHALLDEAKTDQRESVDLFARAYTDWAGARVAYAQGDASYDKGDDAYDKGDDAYDEGDKAYDKGDYDRFNTLYDAGDAWYDEGDDFYDQGDVLYVQGDVLVGTGNDLVDEAEGLREEAWRLLKEVRELLCGLEDAPEAEEV
jgi:hypothetical protein